MAKFPSLPLFTDALLGDTQHLSTVEFGAYILMLIVAWRTPDCRLPMDDAQLSRITRTYHNWGRIRKTVLAFWVHDPATNTISQKRLVATSLRVAEIVHNNSLAGRASALKRKRLASTNVGTDVKRPFNISSTSKAPTKTKDTTEAPSGASVVSSKTLVGSASSAPQAALSADHDEVRETGKPNGHASKKKIDDEGPAVACQGALWKVRAGGNQYRAWQDWLSAEFGKRYFHQPWMTVWSEWPPTTQQGADAVAAAISKGQSPNDNGAKAVPTHPKPWERG